MKQILPRLALFSTGFISMVAHAQPPPQPSRLFATSYVGLAGSAGAASPFVKVGLQGQTGIEYRVTRAFWLTAGLNFDVYGFKRTDNGVTINGTLGFVAISSSVGFSPLPRAIWQPYLSVGIGLVRLSGPGVEADYVRQQVIVSPITAFYPVIQGSVGVQRLLTRDVTGFAEVGYQGLPAVRYANIGLLQLAAIHLGAKTPITTIFKGQKPTR